MSPRSWVLDVLRAVAILLVFGRHIEPCPEGTSTFLHRFTLIWRDGGWAGVDLFFVLSGFLVSGLLFREHKLRGDIQLKRFFIRRGLKIYPAFFVFLGVAASLSFVATGALDWHRLLAEATFTQNYFPALFRHTWSLAVEEHFYICLGLLLAFIMRPGRDPTAQLGALFLFVALACLSFRLAARTPDISPLAQLTPTHKRFDSLFAGVLLASLYHYRPRFKEWVSKVRLPAFLLGLAAFSVPFAFPLEKTPWMSDVGFSLVFFGAASILAAALTWEGNGNRLWRAIAFVGANSYSIYLWHMVAGGWLVSLVARVLPARTNWLLYCAVYLGGGILLGISMAKLVELPVLRLRERLFPSVESQARKALERGNPLTLREDAGIAT